MGKKVTMFFTFWGLKGTSKNSAKRKLKYQQIWYN